MIRIGPTEEQILKSLTDMISTELDSVGIFNRVFSRIKTKSSIEKKIELKRNDYLKLKKKMQDVFGIRVTVYFDDDEKIAVNLVKKLFQEIPEAHSIDPIDKERFGPIRNNLVFQIEKKFTEMSSLFDEDFIDTTFEVQFRTVLSEGWHEVEHDLRYKCKEDWKNEDFLFRQLNGQLATLETCNWAMLKLFDELAYKKYKLKEWASFFRNALRIRFEDMNFGNTILKYLNKNPSFCKEILKHEREVLISPLTQLTKTIPLKMDNVLFIVNRYVIDDDKIKKLEPTLLRQILDESIVR